MKITYSLLSNNGDRPVNEDYIGTASYGGFKLFALADGLGGHGMGKLASETAVHAACALFEAGEISLDTLFVNAQNTLYSKQEERNNHKDAKTTLVLLSIGEETVQWGHIGDSRAYAFCDGKLIGRTLDHSVPQMLVSIGEIRERQIRGHEDRNRLLRVLGAEYDSPKHEIGCEMPVQKKQAFLLCSDGFWEFIVERKMVSALKRARSAEEWLMNMEIIIKKNGRRKEMDNYSAICIWLDA